MSTGQSLMVRLGLDSAAFQGGLQQATGAAKSFGTGLLGVLGVGLGVDALMGFVSSIFDFSGALQDASDNLSINAERLQELHHAFGLGGVSAEEVNKSLTKLNQTLQSAKDGNVKAIATYEDLGISWEDLNTLSPDEILLKMADAAAKSSDKSKTLSDLMEVLGKGGAKLAGTMMQGGDAIRGMMGEAPKMTAENIAAIAELGDAWETMWNRIRIAGGNAVGFLTEGTNALMESLVQISNFENPFGESGDKAFAQKYAAQDRKNGGALKKKSLEEQKQDIEKKKEDIANNRPEAKAAREEQEKADKKTQENAEKLAKMKQEAAFEELTDAQKLADLKERMANIGNEADSSGTDSLKKSELLIENEKLLAEHKKLTAKIEEESTKEILELDKEHQKLADEKAKEEAEAAKEAMELAKARAEMENKNDIEIQQAAIDQMPEITQADRDLKAKENMLLIEDQLFALAQKRAGADAKEKLAIDEQINSLNRKKTALEANNKEARVGQIKADLEAGPHGAAERKRAENAAKRLKNKADRMDAVKERGGISEADWAAGKRPANWEPPRIDARPAEPAKPPGPDDMAKPVVTKLDELKTVLRSIETRVGVNQ